MCLINFKYISIYPGESAASTSAYVANGAEEYFNVEINMRNAANEDTYTEAYAKRINYNVKNHYTNDIYTQGTLYYSTSTNYLKDNVSYSVPVSVTAGQTFRLHLQAPGLNGNAEGYIRFYDARDVPCS